MCEQTEKCWFCGERKPGPAPAFAFVCWECDEKIERNRNYRQFGQYMKLLRKDQEQTEGEKP